MNPTEPDTGRSTAHPQYLINARVAYDTYLAESTAAYRTYLANLAAARSAGLPADHQSARKCFAGLTAVRHAGPPAVWAAGLIAVRAAGAYGKYLASLTALQSAALSETQPTAESSDAQRAATAAAESAAAYQKYVAGRAADGGVSEADRSLAAPAPPDR